MWEATEQTDGKHNQKTEEKNIKMTVRCAKPSRCWARRGQSWAQHNVRKDQDETKKGGGFKLDKAWQGKNRRQGESLDKTKTKQTVQLRTSKIHKTGRQAGGFNEICYHGSGK